jgi:dUTP pyrophosphatase
MENRLRGFEVVADEHRKTKGDVTLPLRGTKTAAGYDFVATKSFVVPPFGKLYFWTDIKAYMQPDEYLSFKVRSSIGDKKDLMLTNTEGIVDSDYYNNPTNDGNMRIGLRNLSNNTVAIEKGERVVQAIFRKYLPSDNCNTENERTGGFGSTGL